MNHLQISSKNKNYTKLLDAYVLFVLIFATSIDTFTGISLRYGILGFISFSQVFKFILMLVFGLKILMGNNAMLKVLLFCLAFLLFFFSAVHLRSANYLVSVDWVLNLKVILLPLSFLYFYDLLQEENNFLQKKLKLILQVNFSVIAINILLGSLGIGFSQYSGGIGSIGFFYAGNDISTLFILLNALLLYINWQNNKKTTYMLLAILGVLVSVLSATKVAMLGVVLSIVCIPSIHYISDKAIFTWKNFRYAAGVFALLLILALLAKPILDKIGLLEMWEYWYQRHNFQLLTLLLSGRDKMLAMAWDTFLQYSDTIDMLFGKGQSAFFAAMNKNVGIRHFVEMDPFDILFLYGFFGVFLFVLGFTIVVSKGIHQFKTQSNKTFPLFYLWLLSLLIIISFLAGHVFISGISAVYIGLFLSLIFALSKNKI